MNKRLKEARRELGLTQNEFAEKIGFTQSAYAMLESGANPIGDRHIKPICAIFNINEQWLRTGNGYMFSENRDVKEVSEIFDSLNDENKELAKALLKTILDKQDDPSDPSGF